MSVARISPYAASEFFKLFEGAVASLHSSSPAADDPLLSELTGGGYSRIPVLFEAIGVRTIANPNSLVFTNLPPVVITHIGIWDASGLNLILSSDVRNAGRNAANTRLVIESYDLAINFP